MGPWLCVATYGARDVNLENISKVANFDIVNECGDAYTTIATDQVLDELTQAQALLKTIFIFQWIAMGIVMAEIGTVLIALLILCLLEVCEGQSCICECLRPHRRHDEYQLLDRPPEEPYSFGREFVTFLKSYMIFN